MTKQYGKSLKRVFLLMTTLLLTNSVDACDKYKAIFFDLDDTLVDFKRAEHESLHLVYKEFYKEIVDECSFSSLFHSINKQLWEEFEQGKGQLSCIGQKRFEILSKQISVSVDTIGVADFYEHNLAQKSTWLPGAEETIKKLKSDYVISIVTNGFSRVQRNKHRILSMEDWCESYIVSEEVGAFKPNKKIFDIALNSVNLSPHQVLMVGDSITSDYKGALNATIDFCWVNKLDNTVSETLPPPKYIIKSVEELIHLLN